MFVLHVALAMNLLRQLWLHAVEYLSNQLAHENKVHVNVSYSEDTQRRMRCNLNAPPQRNNSVAISQLTTPPPSPNVPLSAAMP